MMTKVACLLLTWLLLAPQALACVGCRDAGADTEPETVAAGIAFSWSVLFMLGFALFVVGGLVAMIVKRCRELDNP